MVNVQIQEENYLGSEGNLLSEEIHVNWETSVGEGGKAAAKKVA